MFEAYNDAFVAAHLIPAGRLALYPPFEDRAFWTGLDKAVKAEMIRRGEAWLDYAWPSLLAARYMDFIRTGDRSRYEKDYFERRMAVIDLMIAECVEGQGRFMDQLVNGAWLICEETSWTLPAHGSHDGFDTDPLPDAADSPRDLFACETAAQMAALWQIMGKRLEAMSRRLPLRIREETLRRVVRPACRSYSFWMGIDNPKPLNNWAPWCASTTLVAVLTLGEGEGMRQGYVSRMLATLERFAGPYGDDGGCDEGPAYWGRAAASFFDALVLLHRATGGAIDVFTHPKVQAMGLYLPKMHISGDWYVNFADCVPRPSPTADHVYRYGVTCKEPRLAAFGAWLAHRRPERALSHGYSVISALEQLTVYGPMMAHEEAYEPRELDWFGDIEVAVARQGDMVLAAKGGHNDESHNHNDIGSFVLYRGGEPALIDAGTLTYSRKTFSDRRYEIWTMDSSYHNLPDFGGQAQSPGRRFAAQGASVTRGEDGVTFTVEAGRAWAEGVESYRRRLALSGALMGEEYYRLDAPRAATFHFMLIDEPMAMDGGWRIACKGGDLALTWAGVTPTAVTVDVIEPKDERMNGAWGRERLYRLNVTLPPAQEGRFTWALEPLED